MALILMISLALGACGEREHTCLFDIKNTENEYLYMPATCARGATYYYSCACGEAGEEIFETDGLASHEYSVKNIDEKYLCAAATCTHGTSYYYSCTCGKAGEATFEISDKLAHEYSVKNTEEAYLNTAATCTHGAIYSYSCSCGKAGEATFETDGLLAHDYSVKNTAAQYFHAAATCEHGATYYYSCVCGKAGTTVFETDERCAHEYALKNTDIKYLNTAATCEHGATYYYSCVCGKAGTEIFETEETISHEYAAHNTDAQYLKREGDCLTQAEYYVSCTYCGAISDQTFLVTLTDACRFENQVAEERYLKSEATTESPAIYYQSCLICGEAGEETFLYGVAINPAYLPRELNYELRNFRTDEYEFTWISDEEPVSPRLQIIEGDTFDLYGKYKQYYATATRNPNGEGYLMRVTVDLDSATLYTYRAYDARSRMASVPVTVRTEDTTFRNELYLMGTASESNMFGCVVLTKNHTIVFDGGRHGADGEQLAEFLKEKSDGKVDAWFFTHPHSDHIGAFYHIATQHPDIEVAKIYHHFPSIEELESNRREEHEADMYRNISPFLDERVHITQTNEVFTFDKVKIKVVRVYHPELINANFTNESSSVYRVKSPRSSLLILGDLGVEGGEEVMANCALEDLRTEYIQMAHHGQGGVARDFYEYVVWRKALVPTPNGFVAETVTKCLWPTPAWLWDNNLNGQGYNTGPWSTIKTRKWMEELGVTVHYVAKDGTQKIDF